MYKFQGKSVDNAVCVKCLKCLKECRKGGINYGVKPFKSEFSPKRREFIFTASALVLLGGAYKAGKIFAENAVKKFKNIILPAGAENPDRMFNKCFNCNLCVQNCPNKILTKSDKDFKAVHIDYKKGEGFCKFDCRECSRVCPTGAIRKISLEEKQNTRIAMASVIDEKCLRCGICIPECPKGAISKSVDGLARVDSALCIGCGKCAKSCPNSAIEIFAIKRQDLI